MGGIVPAILGYNAAWAAAPAFYRIGGRRIASPQRGVDVRPVDSPGNLYCASPPVLWFKQAEP